MPDDYLPQKNNVRSHVRRSSRARRSGRRQPSSTNRNHTQAKVFRPYLGMRRTRLRGRKKQTRHGSVHNLNIKIVYIDI